MIKKEEYNSCLAEFYNQIKSDIKDNLRSIILRGSMAKDTLLPPFSDIDLLIVVNDVDFDLEKKINDAVKRSESKYGIRIGCDIMSYDERPKNMGRFFMQNDKNLILLLEMMKGGKFLKIIYGENVFDGVFIENFNEYLKEDCIRSILFFIGKKRKNITNVTKANLSRNIKLAFVMVKAALKYYEKTPFSYDETIKMAENMFYDFNFETLKKLNKIRIQWEKEENINLEEVSSFISKFMEDFKKYFFKRIQIKKI